MYRAFKIRHQLGLLGRIFVLIVAVLSVIGMSGYVIYMAKVCAKSGDPD